MWGESFNKALSILHEENSAKMTNRDELNRLSTEDFYRKLKKMFTTMSKTEIIAWLNSESVKPRPIEVNSDNRKQRCPNCGQHWTWSQPRWNFASQHGYLYIKCKKCGLQYVAWGERKQELRCPSKE